MWLYAITVFLSAFLLFQVQPMIAKMILPWFGGTAAVWATCLLFFQAALLAGYGYTHGIVRRLSPRRQWMLHAALLALALTVLPILPDAKWKPGRRRPSRRPRPLLQSLPPDRLRLKSRKRRPRLRLPRRPRRNRPRARRRARRHARPKSPHEFPGPNRGKPPRKRRKNRQLPFER